MVAALGIFDGVHRGHQKILVQAVARARRLRGRAVAITFDPHPLTVLHPKRAPPRLMSLEDRRAAFADCGIRASRVLSFTRSFSRWSPQRFVREILIRSLGVREVVVGHDFRFGADRIGTPETLRELGKQYGFRVWVAAAVRIGGERVSSGRIREQIAAGDLRSAARFLGRPPSVTGRVVRGAGRGARLGFPTANLKVESGLLPPVGVYAVAASKRVPGLRPGTLSCSPLRAGMANLGRRPTFDRAGGRAPLLEVHLFGVRRRLYGRRLRVQFLQHLRAERRFASAEALSRQLDRDARRAKRVFALQARWRMV